LFSASEHFGYLLPLSVADLQHPRAEHTSTFNNPNLFRGPARQDKGVSIATGKEAGDIAGASRNGSIVEIPTYSSFLRRRIPLSANQQSTLSIN
jgi:hypothetical protein